MPLQVQLSLQQQVRKEGCRVTLDTTYGNITEEKAERLSQAAGHIDEVSHEPGSTEPWISRLVADFIIARGARTVLETGCFKGATSVWIQFALQHLGGGVFHFCDMDRARAMATSDRLQKAVPDVFTHNLVRHCWFTDILELLQTPVLLGEDTRFDLVFVDDAHEKPHVTKELMLLMPKMNPGGLILLHDVFGVCDLKTVVQQFGGYSIDLPRLGPAGGLGIIQC
jgi:predicted O-methyltransferase YrrM